MAVRRRNTAGLLVRQAEGMRVASVVNIVDIGDLQCVMVAEDEDPVIVKREPERGCDSVFGAIMVAP